MFLAAEVHVSVMSCVNKLQKLHLEFGLIFVLYYNLFVATEFCNNLYCSSLAVLGTSSLRNAV